MNDAKKEMIQEASEYWELGILQILFDRKLLTEEEYSGIVQIVKKDYAANTLY